ncbi:MAG: amidohydrolase [Chloroflexota bacterium]|nr:MAG: amidohydrolase [Chloroflexota bacterium]
MAIIDFQAEAEALRDELVARRRDLHMHPELAFEEVRTAGIVAQTLGELGLEVQTGVGKTGVVGILEGAQDGPTVLVRADMDALPIQEANQSDYVSTVPGKMHACGHDGHTSILLGVAKLLAGRRAEIAGRVKFVFQPAEETGKGAKAMVADGVLRDPKPDVSLGLHLWNPLPFGVFGVADGPVMAGASTFDITISGKGGHAALPHLNNDPIVCAAQLVTALQSIVSRNVDPLDTAVITVTSVHAGDAYNVTPQQAVLKGTFRTFSHAMRDLLTRRIAEVSEAVCRAMNCAVEVDIRHDTDPVINHPEVSARVRNALRAVVGEDKFDLSMRTMGAEDMSALMTDIPGMYFFVGARDRNADGYYGHHHPKFSFDEDALPLAVAAMTAAISAFVIPETP